MPVPDPGREVTRTASSVGDVPTIQEEARALGDPTRHAIFRHLAEASGPLTIAQLTGYVGLHHTAVRQHLAKLLAAGLVVEEPEPRTTRGRPRLHYTVAPAAAGRWGITGPYERLAVLLAEALCSDDPPAEVGRRTARKVPAIASGSGDPVGAVASEMARQGFEPARKRRRGGEELVLGNCPYQAAALVNPAAVCALHLGLAQGVADRVGRVEVTGLVPRDPRRAGCRLLLRISPDAS